MISKLRITAFVPVMLLVGLALCAPAFSQTDLQVFEMTDDLYRIQGPGLMGFTVSLMVLKGEAGLLVVDAGYANTVEEMVRKIGEIGTGKVTTMIYTHIHGDHVGASRTIAPAAEVIAQENTARRLDLQYGFWGEESPVIVPGITFTDSMIIDFEGQKVRLYHFPKAHTDGDVIVYFEKSKVVFLGDLVFGDMMPFVHGSRGGTITGLRKAMASILEMFGDDVTFIPSHGQPYSRAKVADYAAQLTKVVEVVEAEMDKGKSVEEMLAADILSEWRMWAGPLYNSDTFLVGSIYENKIYTGNPPEPIGDVMLTIVLEKGAAAAVEFYREAKANQPDRYDFSEAELNGLGYNLMWRKMLDEAEVIFALNIEMFPESGNVYDSMGELYMSKGDKEQAIAHYQRSLELNPENQNAVDMLKKLRESP